MNNSAVLSLIFALICTAAFGQEAEHPGHRVLTQGNGNLVLLDNVGEVEWQMPWQGIHDIHQLPSGNIMTIDQAHVVVEIDPTTKKVVWSYDSAKNNGNEGKKVEVHAIQPLENGNVMIAESGAGRIIEVDRAGTLQKEISLKLDHPHPHTDTRLARKIANGNYLVCHEGDGVLREYDGKGQVVWEYEVPLFDKPTADGHDANAWGNKLFSALRLENGNTLIATGNGHSVLQVTPAKEIVWHLKQNELKGVQLAWVTTLAVLSNGNYLIGNCHAGPEQPQLVEIEPKTKTVVWEMRQFDRLGNDVSNAIIAK